MKIVIVGAASIAVATADTLISRKHDVIIIEADKERIDALKDSLDCGFINGDGTKPAILRETKPTKEDLLLCLTKNDQANILASLVGRSLGFERIVTKIEDPELEHICRELGLSDIIIPDRNTAQTLVDMVTGEVAEDFATFFKGNVRLFSFVRGEDDPTSVEGLSLPEHTRPIMIYRDDEVILPDPDTALEKGDEVVLITMADRLDSLKERWHSTDRQGDGTKPVAEDGI
jgi:trk system potassium uptake protein TrkA